MKQVQRRRFFRDWAEDLGRLLEAVERRDSTERAERLTSMAVCRADCSQAWPSARAYTSGAVSLEFSGKLDRWRLGGDSCLWKNPPSRASSQVRILAG